MQLLGKLFEYVLAKRAEELNILGATSGDTGSSAEYATARQARHPRVHALAAPRMSPFQTAQMFSLLDPNIFNIAVRGVFDDCQDMVKAVSNDTAFQVEPQDRRRQLDQLGAGRGAGRVLLQGLFRGDEIQLRTGRFRRALG